MATAQLMRKTETSWDLKTYAALAQQTITGSANFFKKLVGLSISNIAYQYNIFPKNLFADRRIGDIPIKVLRSNKTSPDAYQLLKWLDGAFDALDRKYLKQLVFGLSTEENKAGEVFESFTFNFTYTEQGELSVDYETASGHLMTSDNAVDQIMKKTVSLFSSNHVYASSRPPLPPGKIEMSVKLYYHEGTPEDYEPPCFQACQEKSFKYPSKPTALQLGKLETPWHKFGMVVTTSEQDQFAIRTPSIYNTPVKEKTSRTKIPRKKTPANKLIKNSQGDVEMLELDDEVNYHSDSTVKATPEIIKIKSPERESPYTQESSKKFCGIKPLNCLHSSQPYCSPHMGFAADAPHFSPGHPGSGVSTTGSRATLPHEGKILCPCTKGDQLSGSMLLCDSCGLWQHAICFGLMYESGNEEHRCVMCAKISGLPCTDPDMPTLSDKECKDLCIYRHALALCTEVHRMDLSIIHDNFELDEADAKLLLKKLEADKVLNKRAGPMSTKGINRTTLTNTVIPKYFLCAKKDAEKKLKDATEALQDLTTSPGEKTSALIKKHSPSQLYAAACNQAQMSLKLDKAPKKKSPRKRALTDKNENSEPSTKKQKVSKSKKLY